MNAATMKTESKSCSHSKVKIVLGTVAILFGLLTIKAGTTILFFEGSGTAAAGNYVPFVLIFNTFAGFVYIVAGAGILLSKQWAKHLATLLVVSSALVFLALGVHVALGQPFEIHTIVAMVLRTSFWGLAAFLLRRIKSLQFKANSGTLNNQAM